MVVYLEEYASSQYFRICLSKAERVTKPGSFSAISRVFIASTAGILGHDARQMVPFQMVYS